MSFYHIHPQDRADVVCADRTGNRKARPSSTPATASAQSAGACTPRSGVVHVTSPEAEGRPQLNGFLSMRANRFGQYGYTADKNDALEVTVNDCTGTPFDITSSVRMPVFWRLLRWLTQGT